MKRTLSRSKRDRILRDSNWMCIFCGDPADVVDHIVPFAYSEDDKESNLAASCSVCNTIAGSKVFDRFIEKQTYILEERLKNRWAKYIDAYRSLCQAVGLPLPIKRQGEGKPPPKKPKARHTPIDGSHRMKPPPQILPYKTVRDKEKENVNKPGIVRKKDLQTKTSPIHELLNGGIGQSYRDALAGINFLNILCYQICFNAKHVQGKTWRQIAEPYDLKPNMARLIANGHEPGNKIRKMLNLPPKARVISVNGDILDGSLVLGSMICLKCGQQFVSNHPRRQKCFICSPFRSRKVEAARVP